MTADHSHDVERRRFRRTLVRVLLVQAGSLLMLWVLQSVYNVA
jgi:hypothetical protein